MCEAIHFIGISSSKDTRNQYLNHLKFRLGMGIVRSGMCMGGWRLGGMGMGGPQMLTFSWFNMFSGFVCSLGSGGVGEGPNMLGER